MLLLRGHDRPTLRGVSFAALSEEGEEGAFSLCIIFLPYASSQLGQRVFGDCGLDGNGQGGSRKMLQI